MVDVIEDAEIRRLASRILYRVEVAHPDDPEEEWFTAEHRILPEEFAAPGDEARSVAVICLQEDPASELAAALSSGRAGPGRGVEGAEETGSVESPAVDPDDLNEGVEKPGSAAVRDRDSGREDGSSVEAP